MNFGYAAFRKHKDIWKSTRVPIHTKIKNILPCLIYVNYMAWTFSSNRNNLISYDVHYHRSEADRQSKNHHF